MHRTKVIAAHIAVFVVVIIPQSGCVLPGALRGVGGQAVDGRLVDSEGKGIPNARIILLQGHFDRLDRKSAVYLDRSDAVYQVERVGISTDSDGHFSHKFTGFHHCHPTWIFPPLLTLPSKISGDTRHGTFFIIQTPDPGGHIYEITVAKPQPSVLIFDPNNGRRTAQPMAPAKEKLNVRSQLVPWIYSTGYTGHVERVFLQIVRPQPFRVDQDGVLNGNQPLNSHTNTAPSTAGSRH